MYPLFETILIENRTPRNLFWHQQRVVRSFRKLDYEAQPPDLEKIIEIPDWIDPKKTYRLRINYNDLSFESVFTEYLPRPIDTLKMVHSQDISYDLKFSDRFGLNNLYQRRESADDVLIVKNGIITDTSVANIVFWDGMTWVTPANPLLMGTARSRLLAEGLITEQSISVDMLNRFLGWNVINALRSFNPQTFFPVSSILK